MFVTAEIRWFWPAADPGPATGWFAAGNDLPEPEVRTDRYLLLAGCRTVGIKLREGRFEVKALSEEPAAWSFPEGPAGRPQLWVKWSLASPRLPEAVSDLELDGTWIEVTKERRQLWLGESSGAFRETASFQGETEMGCQVELTRVAPGADGPSWFTFALEAFGAPRGELPGRLQRAAGEFFGRRGVPPGTVLEKNRSLSYPGWLNLLYGSRC